MIIQQQIEQKLNDALQPAHLQVLNQSHMHNVPKGSESHFKVIAVTEEFAGLNRVKRHQLIYQLLKDELASGVHALSMHCYTPEEWQDSGESSPETPNCRGGFGQ